MRAYKNDDDAACCCLSEDGRDAGNLRVTVMADTDGDRCPDRRNSSELVRRNGARSTSCAADVAGVCDQCVPKGDSI